MQINILSIFPEYFHSPLSCGLMAKARDRGLLEIKLVNPRDFSLDKHKSVDDRPYGGGPGMVMALDPLIKAVESISEPGKVITLSPQGRIFNQEMALELADFENLTLICGRYEGIDDRFQDLIDSEPVSLGDFVLNGGEGAALCLIEAVARLQPEFMGCQDSARYDSFSQGILEYPHYTRPANYRGLSVPEVLISGDHARVEKWRRTKALERTLDNRPELLENAKLTKEDCQILAALPRLRQGRNLYLALIHYPVLNKDGHVTTVSLTNLDIHDIGRVCTSYGLGGFFLISPLKDQQRLARRLINHWLNGYGQVAIPDRAKAVQNITILDSWQEAITKVRERAGQDPYVIATSAKNSNRMVFKQVRQVLDHRPVLLLFGTGFGLSSAVMQQADAVLRPIRYLDSYNHLSVRSAVSVIIDRILKDYY